MKGSVKDYKDFISDNPDYVDALEGIVKYEKENKDPNHAFIEDTDLDSKWEYDNVGVHPSRLQKMVTSGVVKKVFDTNSTTAYSLANRDSAVEALNNIPESTSDGFPDVTHEFPDESDLPDDIFDNIVGYEDPKWLLKRALTTDEIVNIALVGPTGSAKTIFLMEINKLQNSVFVSAKSSSGPGVLDVMFEKKPMNLCIDEFDDMDKDAQEALSQQMDNGMLDETKYGKNRKMKINTNTFASANSLDPLIEQMEDRVNALYFDPYTRDEFMDVCVKLLPDREGSSKEEAKKIAKKVWELEGEGDVRSAIGIARLSNGDVDKVISVFDKYSNESLDERIRRSSR